MNTDTLETCATCGADLTKAGAVRYVEKYDAYIDGYTVVYASHTVDSSAACVRCGALIYYYDVEGV